MLQVVKLGGSLLTRPSLIEDLHQWRCRQRHRQTLAIVGGGRMIDAVRQWDRLRPAASPDVHWLCVDLLAGSLAHLRAALTADDRFADTEYLSTPREWTQWRSQLGQRQDESPIDTEANFPPKVPSPSSGQWWWVNVPAFYHRRSPEEAARPCPLPETWETTTDAIAWWLADQLSADRCILLKSCHVPHPDTPEPLIDAGIIDGGCRHLLRSPVPLVVQTLPVSDT